MIRYHAEVYCDFKGCNNLQGYDFDNTYRVHDFAADLYALGWFSIGGDWYCDRHRIVTILDEPGEPCSRRRFHTEVVNK